MTHLPAALRSIPLITPILIGWWKHPCQAAPPVMNTTGGCHHLIQEKHLFSLAQARSAVWGDISLILLREPLLWKSPKVLFYNISFDVSLRDFLVPELADLSRVHQHSDKSRLNADQTSIYSIPHGIPVPQKQKIFIFSLLQYSFI